MLLKARCCGVQLPPAGQNPGKRRLFGVFKPSNMFPQKLMHLCILGWILGFWVHVRDMVVLMGAAYSYMLNYAFGEQANNFGKTFCFPEFVSYRPYIGPAATSKLGPAVSGCLRRVGILENDVFLRLSKVSKTFPRTPGPGAFIKPFEFQPDSPNRNHHDTNCKVIQK